MKILDEIDVSEGRIKQTRLNIAIQEDRISDVGNPRESIMASQNLLAALEDDLASYVDFHKKLLAIAVVAFRHENSAVVARPRGSRLH